jgi:chemotaxis protein methyltransferase WspC
MSESSCVIKPHLVWTPAMFSAPDDPLATIAAVLNERIGLNAAVIGRESLRQAAELRAQSVGVASLGDYAALLQRSAEEQAELVEEVIVPESWFFRDVQPLECARDFVRSLRLREPQRVIRVLSVPCSRGEEPYSLAIGLLDLGLSPDEVSVLGVDVSRRSLTRARAGRFGLAAVREKDALSQRLQDTYFVRDDNGLLVRADVRAMVSFAEANLTQPDFLRDVPPFDVIFCRNVLIYFDDASRTRALQNLRRLLAADGLLYVGNSEIRVTAEFGFRHWSRHYLASFAHESAPAPSHSPSPPPSRPAAPKSSARRPANRVETPAPASLQPAVPMSRVPEATTREAIVEQVRAAADRGNYAAAQEQCLAELQREPHPDIYFWQGMIHHAQGDFSAAETAFRKALYLDPEHADTLWHMAILCDGRGDSAGAANYRRRARAVSGGEA